MARPWPPEKSSGGTRDVGVGCRRRFTSACRFGPIFMAPVGFLIFIVPAFFGRRLLFGPRLAVEAMFGFTATA